VRLVLANEKLVVEGRAFPGFPLLIGDDGNSIQPAQRYLWWRLIERPARIQSDLTWERYGQALYDFFGYCHVNKLDWTTEPLPGRASAIQAYRDWSRGDIGLTPRTINQRVGIVVGFYEWALKHQHIQKLPFEYELVKSGRQEPGFLAHVDASGGMVESTSLRLPQPKRKPKFLTNTQVKVCWEALSNVTHRLMFELMVRTGLRQVECRTFPEKYVFDPSRRKDLVKGQKIRIELDSRDMKLKNNKPRPIDLPYDLMEDLWAYSVRHRQKRERMQPKGSKYPVLFLTEGGEPYQESSLTKIFRGLSERVSFPVHPHILRHTYATYLLWSLRKSLEFKGEPLQYVADRLGHSNISTTMVYLHLINELDAQMVLAHEDEIDKLFAEKDKDDGRTTQEV
jgi:site-specific recombinase XerD